MIMRSMKCFPLKLSKVTLWALFVQKDEQREAGNFKESTM